MVGTFEDFRSWARTDFFSDFLFLAVEFSDSVQRCMADAHTLLIWLCFRRRLENGIHKWPNDTASSELVEAFSLGWLVMNFDLIT